MDRLVVVKRHGDEEAFEEEKLYASVYHTARDSGRSEQDAEAVAETVTDAVVDWLDNRPDEISSRQLRAKVIDLLEAHAPGLVDAYRDDVRHP